MKKNQNVRYVFLFIFIIFVSCSKKFEDNDVVSTNEKKFKFEEILSYETKEKVSFVPIVLDKNQNILSKEAFNKLSDAEKVRIDIAYFLIEKDIPEEFKNVENVYIEEIKPNVYIKDVYSNINTNLEKNSLEELNEEPEIKRISSREENRFLFERYTKIGSILVRLKADKSPFGHSATIALTPPTNKYRSWYQFQQEVVLFETGIDGANPAKWFPVYNTGIYNSNFTKEYESFIAFPRPGLLDKNGNKFGSYENQKLYREAFERHESSWYLFNYCHKLCNEIFYEVWGVLLVDGSFVSDKALLRSDYLRKRLIRNEMDWNLLKMVSFSHHFFNIKSKKL